MAALAQLGPSSLLYDPFLPRCPMRIVRLIVTISVRAVLASRPAAGSFCTLSSGPAPGLSKPAAVTVRRERHSGNDHQQSSKVKPASDRFPPRIQGIRHCPRSSRHRCQCLQIQVQLASFGHSGYCRCDVILREHPVQGFPMVRRTSNFVFPIGITRALGFHAD